MTVVTQTDRPKSVHNRCVIEVFGGIFVLSIGYRIFCWYRGFCHMIESDLLLFLFVYTKTIAYRINKRAGNFMMLESANVLLHITSVLFDSDNTETPPETISDNMLPLLSILFFMRNIKKNFY